MSEPDDIAKILRKAGYIVVDPFFPARWEFVCECGEVLDPLSPDWRCAGSYWEHYHGYPIGHAAVFKRPLPPISEAIKDAPKHWP
jgi:hypothetical protein